MAVTVISGSRFPGVEFGTAPGTGNGYVIGTTPILELLRVDEETHCAKLVGVKYSHHEVTDPPCADRPPDPYVRMTMLVEGGPWRQWMWSVETRQSVELVLKAPGDFIAWEPGMWHRWSPEGTATMVTVSFKRVAV